MRFPILFTAALLALAPFSALAAITVHEQGTIDRDQVLVGDLFDGAGDAAMQPVGTAPAAGQRNTYDVSALMRVAKAYDLDWKPQRLDIKSVINRASTKVTTAQIQQAVTDVVLAQLPGDAAKGKVDVQLDRRALDIDLPADTAVTAIKLVDSTYDPKSYRFTGTLAVEQSGGRDPYMTPLTGRAVPQLDVPVIAKRIESGAVIGDSDLDIVQMAADRIGPDMVRDRTALIGKETRRALTPGSTVAERDLRAAQLVKRGTTVTMIVERGALRITARGRALADAAVGEQVRVQNLQSNKTVEGLVQPGGDVLVISNS